MNIQISKEIFEVITSTSSNNLTQVDAMASELKIDETLIVEAILNFAFNSWFFNQSITDGPATIACPAREAYCAVLLHAYYTKMKFYDDHSSGNRPGANALYDAITYPGEAQPCYVYNVFTKKLELFQI